MAFNLNFNIKPNQQLITGDYAAFQSIRTKYTSWYDILGGWLLFTSPWAKRRDLSAAGAACAGMETTSLSHLDVMVRALLDGDLHQVRRICLVIMVFE